MAGNSEQFSRESSSEFTDDAIRRFLLGQFSAAELSKFEKRLFEDDGLETRVRLAEYELADDYAFNRLALPEKTLFEQKFLLSTDRERKLRVSKALRDRFASVTAAVPFGEKTRITERVRDLFAFTQPARRFAFGVVILLLLIGTLWMALRGSGIMRKFIARRPPAATPTPVASPRAAHHASPILSHHETSSPPMPSEPPEPPAKVEPAVIIVLSPASSMESRQSPLINLPSSEQDIVRLTLSVKPIQAGTLRADLLTSDGQYVFNGQSLKTDDTDGFKVYLDVSARLLKSGEYQIKLTPAEDFGEQVLTYYFRVQ